MSHDLIKYFSISAGAAAMALGLFWSPTAALAAETPTVVAAVSEAPTHKLHATVGRALPSAILVAGWNGSDVQKSPTWTGTMTVLQAGAAFASIEAILE